MAAHDTLFPVLGSVSINMDMVGAVIFKVKEFFLDDSRVCIFFMVFC